MKKIEIEEAIDKAKKGESLEGVVISDLHDTQVRAKDVLLLSDYGIVVPEQNIYYDDADVAYDPEFDDVSWTRLPSSVSLEDQARMVAEHDANKELETASISIELEIKNKEVNDWASSNYDTIKILMNKFVVDLYEARTIIGK